MYTRVVRKVVQGKERKWVGEDREGAMGWLRSVGSIKL